MKISLEDKMEIKRLAQVLKQISPYHLTFTKYTCGDADSLCHLAKVTGSTFKTFEIKVCTSVYNISDPLCQMLEEEGMNK